MIAQEVNAAIRSIPDFPSRGILFKDITPVLQDAELFARTVDCLADEVRRSGAECLAAIDARGFIFGGAIAHAARIGFVPIRKKGKLPYTAIEESYDLEYGRNTLEIHADAIRRGMRVALFDDLLATGGTASAAVRLIERLGGLVVLAQFVMELAPLRGRDKLKQCPISVLLREESY